ncbi:MAG TPA: DUF1015 domain-containing protein [Candidatus Thiothrix moscowensis]|uniref:DUF1015 domain-containing protein n=1 Tax=unclassified Thiothrix TaxID=2636184 RepID=UPI0025D87E3D|nr:MULTISPECIES: DUF1015 domain-containing protein [unclassified Thiothrix]HRJ51990.1 DUF1015 domain-containing protein [Candidatus Thiothrix moscowensis]HRJ92499.1 DUF1015 domain-containing protein [Candidatus Thiothrix moscowensis]
MNLISPFRGLRPAPGRAAEVIAPPYDVLNSTEARERADGKPWSFLHISKPEIDLPEDTDPYSPAVYAKAAENLARTIEAGLLIRDEQPCYYAYRLIMNGHEQTGLVAGASVADYDTNRIRKHEFTRPVKEDDRVRQIDAVNAQTGPVLLAYPDAPVVDRILAAATQRQPVLDATADDGIQHTLWLIDGAEDIAQLTEAFNAMHAIYIADGHHRSAAASRIAKMRHEQHGNAASAPWDYFLSVIFPHHQMKIFDYNRVVRDLHDMDNAQFLAAVEQHFDLQPSATPVKPTEPGTFGMYMDQQWFKLTLHPELMPNDDPVARLDVSRLARYLIEPVLGISDPRRDERIDFVGGIRGLEGLEKRVNSGEMAVAFSLYPTSMADLMAVADNNDVMPPKSTWFEPKLADGVVSYLLD